jgi:signal transduction histidine kinase/DNA-binding NarL/FixJ family response regulator
MDVKSLPKVLYIDDTPDARSLVRRVLAQDFVVLEASDPIGGIELAMLSQPDLILLDINLPHLSGREVAARLKSLLPHARLVAFSADNSPGVRERALAAGCVGYMTKPLDVDTFADEIKEYLGGKRDVLLDQARHEKAYQAEVVEILEEKVRELSKTAERNAFLNEQNKQLIAVLERRQRLLEAAARVGHVITSILDLDELLRVTVDVICEEYDFYYAGLFLCEEAGQAASGEAEKWAVLRAGRGEAGKAMLANDYRLPIDENSIVGTAILGQQARIVLDVGQEVHRFANPYLPDTRAEMALPLIVKGQVLGVLSVQSDQVNAFNDDDINSLQTLANHVAVAIDNAILLRDLKHANQELLRNKTFQAIAQTTGETIHWVGNKAAPIPSSTLRVREDLVRLLGLFQALLAEPPEQREQHPLWSEAMEVFHTVAQQGYKLEPPAFVMPGSLESILEDLAIIEQSARSILVIKEDLIGPVRLQNLAVISLPELLDETIFEMGLPEGMVQTEYEANLPPTRGDRRQLGQVFNNLIKNAWEALYQTPNPHIRVVARYSGDPGFVEVLVIDNGPGIPPDLLEKIWVSFFTTKGERGGTGLGLSACVAIVNQAEGKISVESQVGVGTIFTVMLPVVGLRNCREANMTKAKTPDCR